ncbi:DCN1-like protein 3 [Haliotis rubra]|uniref:DCN1-like protein 3 n=1 Tax=Haliotis rubra TaxID=36100 RepID=UPI001EE5076A|nr:DCN1-like protein 3 [Haliotis rubra]
MGKCLSCCEAPGQPGPDAQFVDPQSAISSSQSRSSTGFVSESKELKRTAAATDTNYGTGRPPIAPSDKKMFTQYPKLPPIKKQSNGDSKRLSLISKDFQESKVIAMFDMYKDAEGDDVILAEGVEKFCEDLDVKPEEYIVLVIAWKFQADQMCRFTRDEFINGCRNLKCDSLKSIRSKFPELLSEVENKQSFKDLYRWTYKFGLDSDTGQRTLQTEMAMSLWKLVFSQHEPLLLDHWLEFLSKHQNIRGIPRDTWDMFLNFTEQVGEDLTTYDDTEAWPSLFDDFVEFENDRQNQNVMTD